MAINVQLNQFNGPLDLLLTLISDKKLGITEVSISEVTDQYLKYVEELEEEISPLVLSDFLVVATKMLLMKAKCLLPQYGETEEEEVSLEEQLRLYKAFLEVSKKLELRWDKQNSYFRKEPPIKQEGFVEPKNVDLTELQITMERVIKKLTPPKPLPKTKIDSMISLKQKLSYFRTIFKSKKRCSFNEMIDDTENRTEVIVSFLALLELVKTKTVYINQSSQFGEILINRSTQ